MTLSYDFLFTTCRAQVPKMERKVLSLTIATQAPWATLRITIGGIELQCEGANTPHNYLLQSDGCCHHCLLYVATHYCTLY